VVIKTPKNNQEKSLPSLQSHSKRLGASLHHWRSGNASEARQSSLLWK
jgi:hypothetical protein